MEHRLAGRVRIAEGYAAEHDMTGLFLLTGSLIDAVCDGGNAVEHLIDTLCGGLCSRDELEHRGYHHDGV